MGRTFAGRVLVAPALLLSVLLTLHVSTAAQVTGPRGTVTGPPIATGTAVIRGTVVALDTGGPLRRVTVRASSAVPGSPPDTGAAVTDDQGRYELRNLVGGRYTVTAMKTGFLSITYGQRRPNERGTPVDVPAGQTVEKITIGLPRGGVIAGRILDELGEPLADAQVRAMRSQFMPGGRRLVAVGRNDQTDDQGAFRLFGLTPGDYVISATARPETGFFVASGQVLQGADADKGFAPTYYPGTPSQSDAQRITLAVGQEVSGVTFGMTPTRVARVTGRVVGGEAEAFESAFVMVMPDDGGMGASTGGGMVQRDGTFTVNGLAPGRYNLRVQSRTAPGADALSGEAAVTVAGADLDNVVIALRPPSTITGRIEFAGGAPPGVSAGQVRVSAVPLDPMARSFMQGPPRVNDDLTFVIRGVTGATLIRAGNVPGWFLESVQAEGDDITDTPVTVRHGAELRDVRIVLSRSSASLSGSVRDDRGAPVVDASVVLFPADETKWTFSSRYVRMTRPAADGTFEIRGLPPSSEYRVIALQGVEDMQVYDPEFLASVRDRAESLTLGAGETKSLDVTLR